MPSIAEVPEYPRKRRREDDECGQIHGKGSSPHNTIRHSSYPDLSRPLHRPMKALSNKRQRVIPLNDQQNSGRLYGVTELREDAKKSEPMEIKRKIDLSPCHICRRKPTAKHELDSFADCEGCGERTCYVCIRECLGSGAAFHDEDMGTEHEYRVDIDAAGLEDVRRREPWEKGLVKTHRGMVCSRCCVERGSEGEVWCLGCVDTQDGI